MEQRIGSCLICGGDVIGPIGTPFSKYPRTAARCINCGNKNNLIQDPTNKLPIPMGTKLEYLPDSKKWILVEEEEK